MILVNSLRKLWRGLKYRLIRLLRIREGAHQVALGFVTGFFPCWFPTFGVGPALSIGLTKFIKGNVLAALISATFGSILWPLLFFMNFKVGGAWRRWFVDVAPLNDNIDDILDLEYVGTVDEINEWSALGLDFLVGSIINSLFFTLLMYVIVRLIIDRYKSTLLQLMITEKGSTDDD
jgi:uncharacterized protein (DUF2062 family)